MHEFASRCFQGIKTMHIKRGSMFPAIAIACRHDQTISDDAVTTGARGGGPRAAAERTISTRHLRTTRRSLLSAGHRR